MLEGCFVLCEFVHESIKRTYNEGFYPAKNYYKIFAYVPQDADVNSEGTRPKFI